MGPLPQSFSCTVEEVVRESDDTATLVLAAAPHPAYRAGQYLSIDPHQFASLRGLVAWLEAAKGKREPVRKYSLTSAPHEPRLAITIKEEESVKYPALLSPLLAYGLEAGDTFTAFGCVGPYVLGDDIGNGLVVHLVAGAGAVPNFSILKDALHRGLGRHLWIASNKRRRDVLFHEALAQLLRAHEGRLTVVNTLTRESADGMRCGRVSRELLDELIPPGERDTCRAFACGPAVLPWDRKAALEAGATPTPRFIESVLGSLHGLGIDDRRIRRETYG